MTNDLGPAQWANVIATMRGQLQGTEDLQNMQKELLLKLDEQITFQKEMANPFYDGMFKEDRIYGETLEEQKIRLEVARSDKKPEHGYLFSINLTFYGEGGKLCSGMMQLDGGTMEFENIQTMFNKGITAPMAVGWYVSQYDNANRRYGVSWRTNDPFPYQELYRILINNNNPRTAGSTMNVTFDLQASRFIKDKVNRSHYQSR